MVLFILLLFSLSFPLNAKETNLTLNTALSLSSNLETPADINEQRTALNMTLSWQQQQLNYNGGYLLNFAVSSNTGSLSNDKKDSFYASYTLFNAINSHWLISNQFSLLNLANDLLPENSHTSFRFNNTLGIINDDQSGIDYVLNLRQEIHRRLSTDRYQLFVPALEAIYYSPHINNTSYWSFSALLSQHQFSEQSNANRIDYRSVALSAQYKQAKVFGFRHDIKVTWQHDLYASNNNSNFFTAQRSHPNNPSTPNNSNGFNNLGRNNRKDTLLFVESYWSKPIIKNIVFFINAQLGKFSSNRPDKVTNFYKISASFSWNFK